MACRNFSKPSCPSLDLIRFDMKLCPLPFKIHLFQSGLQGIWQNGVANSFKVQWLQSGIKKVSKNWWIFSLKCNCSIWEFMSSGKSCFQSHLICKSPNQNFNFSEAHCFKIDKNQVASVWILSFWKNKIEVFVKSNQLFLVWNVFKNLLLSPDKGTIKIFYNFSLRTYIELAN